MGRSLIKTLILLLILAVLVIAGFLVFGQRADGPAAPIKEQFEEKIVYDSIGEEDISVFQNDCRIRGGEFSECGSPCAPDAEVCIQVCALTCEIE